MQEAIKGHNVVDAMHRKGLGWIDFAQGDEKGGIKHIILRRDEQHAEDPVAYPLDGARTLMELPKVIAKGKIISGTPASAVVGIEHEGVRAYLAKSSNSHWILTGFKR